MTLRACMECGSERLFVVEAEVKDPKVTLPVLCRRCGAVHRDGELIDMGAAAPVIKRQVVEVAEQVGKKALLDLEKDPGQRIEAYFARVYGSAFLDGYLRAYAFMRHEVKEGRLARLRELWRAHDVALEQGGGNVFLTMSQGTYSEMRDLIKLGDPDATSPSNPDDAQRKNLAPLP